MAQDNAHENNEPTDAELSKAAGAESYHAEPMDDAELGRVWEAPAAQGGPSPTAEDDSAPDQPPVSEDPA